MRSHNGSPVWLKALAVGEQIITQCGLSKTCVVFIYMARFSSWGWIREWWMFAACSGEETCILCQALQLKHTCMLLFTPALLWDWAFYKCFSEGQRLFALTYVEEFVWWLLHNEASNDHFHLITVFVFIHNTFIFLDI